MLLKSSILSFEKDDNGNLLRAHLYGIDVSDSIKPIFGKIQEGFKQNSEIDLNKVDDGILSSTLKQVLRERLSFALQQNDKSTLKTMIKDYTVEFKPELLNKIKNVLHDSFNQYTEKSLSIKAEIQAECVSDYIEQNSNNLVVDDTTDITL